MLGLFLFLLRNRICEWFVGVTVFVDVFVGVTVFVGVFVGVGVGSIQIITQDPPTPIP